MFTMYCFFDGIFTVIGNNTMYSKKGLVMEIFIIVFFFKLTQLA